MVTAIGTPGFSDLAAPIGTTDLQPYVDAYVAGVRAAFGFGAVIAIGAGVIAWIGLGQGDPLTTVWEHRDERATTQA